MTKKNNSKIIYLTGKPGVGKYTIAKELAKKQEVARQRKIEAEYNERKRFFIENRRLVREQQRKKIIDAARYHCCFIICIILTIFKLIKNKLRKKAEQLIESNEAHLLKSII